LLGGVFNDRTQRTICRSAHLPTIGIGFDTVKLRFRLNPRIGAAVALAVERVVDQCFCLKIKEQHRLRQGLKPVSNAGLSRARLGSQPTVLPSAGRYARPRRSRS
jgi:hypothetical protein